MGERITGRMNDGTAFVHSETGNEGVGYFTTQRRLPEIICKLAELEDKIENGELAEVKHSRWIYVPETLNLKSGYICFACKCTTWHSHDVPRAFKCCPDCGAKMDGKGG